MPITRLDMISMAPKTQQAAQFKHAESQKSFNEQLQINSHFNNSIKHNSMQTVKTSKSDNKEFRYDAKEKGSNSYEDQRNKKKNDKEKESEDNQKRRIPGSSTFDIKI